LRWGSSLYLHLNDLKEQLDIILEKADADKGYLNLKDIIVIEENSKTKYFVPLVKNNKK